MGRMKSRASLSWTLTFCVIASASAGQTTITAESGQNVILPCRVTNDKTIRPVKWSRADQGDEYALLFRDEQFDPEDQHPSFRNRVDLQDRQMKDGNVSLILKDVTTADNGTYKCQVFVSSWKLISTVGLSVGPPGPTGGATEDEEEEEEEEGGEKEGGEKEGGSVGLTVGLSVTAVLLAAAAAVGGFFIYKKQKPQDSY